MHRAVVTCFSSLLLSSSRCTGRWFSLGLSLLSSSPAGRSPAPRRDFTSTSGPLFFGTTVPCFPLTSPAACFPTAYSRAVFPSLLYSSPLDSSLPSSQTNLAGYDFPKRFANSSTKSYSAVFPSRHSSPPPHSSLPSVHTKVPPVLGVRVVLFPNHPSPLPSLASCAMGLRQSSAGQGWASGLNVKRESSSFCRDSSGASVLLDACFGVTTRGVVRVAAERRLPQHTLSRRSRLKKADKIEQNRVAIGRERVVEKQAGERAVDDTLVREPFGMSDVTTLVESPVPGRGSFQEGTAARGGSRDDAMARNVEEEEARDHQAGEWCPPSIEARTEEPCGQQAGEWCPPHMEARAEEPGSDHQAQALCGGHLHKAKKPQAAEDAGTAGGAEGDGTAHGVEGGGTGAAAFKAVEEAAESEPGRMPKDVEEGGAGVAGAVLSADEPGLVQPRPVSPKSFPLFKIPSGVLPEAKHVKVKSAEFVKSSSDVAQCPKDNFPEVAVIGRSNVGKSSLINMLTNRRELAQTSKKPGKTQLINHFLINKQWFLVDLPGYGYAKAPTAVKEEWHSFTQKYFLSRSNLATVLLLVDASIPPLQVDLDCADWLGQNKIPLTLVFTKCDRRKKRKNGGRPPVENVAEFEERLRECYEELPPWIMTSSVNAMGKDTLLAHVSQVISNWKGI